VVAVLAAVSEEIKSRGGTESNTEYFAALVCYAIASTVSYSLILLCFFAFHLFGCRDCWIEFETK